MEIVEPYARMLSPVAGNAGTVITGTEEFTKSHGVSMLRRCENFGRVSHRSEDAQTSDSYDRFLRAVVIGKGDLSIIEHEKVSVDALVDRGITHEIVRHRIGSYTQESTRFVNYGKKGGNIKFIAVPELMSTATTEDELVHAEFIEDCEDSERRYLRALSRGQKPQIARGKLNHHVASRIIITYNLRTWRHFFIMRTSSEAHPQLKQVMIPLLAEFKEKIPILYEDIEPNLRQIDMMRLPR